MPAPPARSRSASVPCGTSSSSSSPASTWRSNSFVLAHVGGHHLADLAPLEQWAHAEIIDAGVVSDDRQFARTGLQQAVNEIFRYAAQAEASGGDGHAVEEQAIERGLATGIHLVHVIRSPIRSLGW